MLINSARLAFDQINGEFFIMMVTFLTLSLPDNSFILTREREREGGRERGGERERERNVPTSRVIKTLLLIKI